VKKAPPPLSSDAKQGSSAAELTQSSSQSEPAVANASAFEVLFGQLSTFLKNCLGHTLFTVSRDLPGGFEVERIYSTLPAKYPTGGKNLVDRTEWTQKMERGEFFVANEPAEFSEHFQNLNTIVSEGFGAVINIPIHHRGKKLGTLNLLDREGAYRGDVSQVCREASEAAVEGFIAYEQYLKQQSTV
jgi:GAF domain-containing protein